jgi:hypothetical protein
MDSAAVGPGAFTDEPDELPQPQVIRDPSFVQAESTEGAPVAEAPVEEVVSEGPVEEAIGDPSFIQAESTEGPAEAMIGEVVSESPVSEAFPERPFETAASEVVDPEPQVEAVAMEAPVESAVTDRAVEIPVAGELAISQPATPVEPVGEAASYFNLPVQEDAVEAPMEALETPVEVYTLGDGTQAPVPQQQSRGFYPTGGIITPRRMPTPPPEQSAPAATVYPMPVYDVHEVWGGVTRKDSEEARSTIPSMNGHPSQTSSIRSALDFYLI